MTRGTIDFIDGEKTWSEKFTFANSVNGIVSQTDWQKIVTGRLKMFNRPHEITTRDDFHTLVTLLS